VGLTFSQAVNFNEDLACHVRSSVAAEAFHMFAAVLKGTLPILATENMNVLLSLVSEFDFLDLP
jgi:hypothetical protein